MALVDKQRSDEGVKLNLSPMIDVVFLILIYFIVSIQMEPSLDDILKLPDAYHSIRQHESRFQVYVLKAKVDENGYIVDADSAGLVALADKGNPDSIFVKLDDLPKKLEARRKEVLEQIVAVKNQKRAERREPPLSEDEIKQEEREMTLMIKADDLTFYGRIIQVVNKAKEIKVLKFALVTTVESSVHTIKSQEEKAAENAENKGS